MLISTSINNRIRDIFYYYFIYWQDLNSMLTLTTITKTNTSHYLYHQDTTCLSFSGLTMVAVYIYFWDPFDCVSSCDSCAMLYSITSDSLQSHGLKLARLLCPWDSQARILEWAAISSSGDFPDLGIKPTSPVAPALSGGFFTSEPPGKPHLTPKLHKHVGGFFLVFFHLHFWIPGPNQLLGTQ